MGTQRLPAPSENRDVILAEVYIAGVALLIAWHLVDEARGRVELDWWTLAATLLWPVAIVLLVVLALIVILERPREA